ncbi:6345_t:CDS:2, partial [Scutellospora calospora]
KPLYEVMHDVLSFASLLLANPVDSSTSNFPDNVYGIQVTSPGSGERYDFGRVHIFASNVSVNPGQENILEYTLPERDPSKNITDDARFAIGIYKSDNFAAGSATFIIGSPKFGLTILTPSQGSIIQSGKPFTVKWTDNFNKYSGRKIVVHLFYFLGDSGIITEVPVDLYTGIPVEDGTYDIIIPSSYPPYRDYGFVLGIIDVLRNNVTEHYIITLTLVD